MRGRGSQCFEHTIAPWQSRKSVGTGTSFDEIWGKPATQVAKEYGISDVGLGKVCRQLNIPKPEPGYWRRKELGLKVRRAPLPAMETVPRVVSSIYEREPEPPLSPSLQALAQLETVPERRIALPNELGKSLHPLVKRTLSALQRGKSSQEVYLQPKALCLDVSRSHHNDTTVGARHQDHGSGSSRIGSAGTKRLA